MRGKVAKTLRAKARQVARMSDPIAVKSGVRYPRGSFRRVYKDLKRAYKRWSVGLGK